MRASLPTRVLIAALLALAAPGLARACDAETDCPVADGDETLGAYRLYRPATAPAEGAGAIIYMHGWQATADGVMRNRGLRQVADRLGVLLVAPQGREKTWSYPSSPSRHRDEFPFFDAMRRDLIETKGVDPDRILVSGFSMGGSMAWYLACNHGDDYMGFAPAAGAFWEPLPESCPEPARYLIHTHGTTDTVVPIEGRPIGGRWAQGDVWESFEVMAKGLDLTRSDDAVDDRGMTCRRWFGEARLYEFCRHGGGHQSRPEWVERAWRMVFDRLEG